MASDDEADSKYNQEYENQNGKCGIIFLIDARRSMFSKSSTDLANEELTKFNTAIKCCRTVLMNKIIAKQKDLVGVVLFGTDKFDPETSTTHLTSLMKLSYPNSESIKQMDTILSDSDALELQRTYGSSDGFSLADALWYCSLLFTQRKIHFEEKRILLFTDDSDPHYSDTHQAHKARKKASDLNQLKISLEILPMGTEFEYSKFYKELVEITNGSSDTELDSTSRLEELLERVNRLDFRTRRYAKLKWNLGKGVALGISLYTLYREATVLAKEPLSRANNEPVRRIKQTFDQGTGELLLATDIVEFVSVAHEDIIFTSEDKEKLNKLTEPCLTLLGFKPLSSAKEGLHCGQASFAYPEESLVKGSRHLMKALVDQCLAKQRVALCCLTPRYRATTKYVYLVPSSETYDSAGNQLTPCGFHIIPLPFSNETREQKFEKSPQVDNETVEMARELVNKLKFRYKPSNFKNPKLQQFWTHLEALALEYQAPDIVEDQTLPDTDAQAVRLGSLATEFNNACSLSCASTSVSKRPAGVNTSSPAKRPKRTLPKLDIVEEIKSAIANQKVDKFTVVQLKEFLTFHNQTVTGLKKASLIEAVYKLKLV
uniref:VWFA domain-containing protein n=1 Tax=Graphocephala atropunctata TaxID=36148 RepID=A0A1B6K8I0_9HEMI